jgi:hypothetical protein
VQRLAVAAMADLGVDRVGTNFVCDGAAMASGAVAANEAAIIERSVLRT